MSKLYFGVLIFIVCVVVAGIVACWKNWISLNLLNAIMIAATALFVISSIWQILAIAFL